MTQKKKNEPKNNSFHTLNYLMKIDQSIRNGEYPNANKLNKILGTQFSRSTFGRYIRTLQDDYGAPVEFDFKKNGYYYTDNTFFYHPMHQQILYQYH